MLPVEPGERDLDNRAQRLARAREGTGGCCRSRGSRTRGVSHLFSIGAEPLEMSCWNQIVACARRTASIVKLEEA